MRKSDSIGIYCWPNSTLCKTRFELFNVKRMGQKIQIPIEERELNNKFNQSKTKMHEFDNEFF